VDCKKVLVSHCREDKRLTADYIPVIGFFIVVAIVVVIVVVLLLFGRLFALKLCDHRIVRKTKIAAYKLKD
jgi:signal transduction histidine kinase